ncbi:unnamed protein product, partial [Effrenium voratum]
MGWSKSAKDAPESYKPYYLKYEELKEMVVEFSREGPSLRSRLQSADIMEMANQPIGRFQDMLRAELQKVNQFACVKHEDVFLGLRRLCEQCRKKLTPEEVAPMAQKIRNMGEEIGHLDAYVRLNYMGFQMLTEKFDLCLGTCGSALFVSGLHCEPFCNIRFDDILILLGLAWARWRAAQSTAEQAKDATWKPPESFIRNTSKYWVQPDKVVMLKTRIVEHLPYLIFGASQSEQEKLLEPFALLDLEYSGMDSQAMSAYSGTMEESQLLSSVYFDSPDAKCYRERIRREEGARLVRFRWYGENNQEDDKEIYIERKIHHEGWGAAKSAKERCVLPQKDVFEFMKGRFDIEAYFSKLAANGTKEKTIKGMKPIAIEVDRMIQEKKLQPIIRTSYYRCAFQLATDNKVRVSLDTQMSLLNEYMANGHPNEPWCLVGSDTLQSHDVYRFPYAILEIKLQDVSEAPLWLRQTLNEIGAIQVHKFSKFQHAMAFLHPQRVPILPHWHQDFEEWHKKKEKEEKPRRGSGALVSALTAEDLT